MTGVKKHCGFLFDVSLAISFQTAAVNTAEPPNWTTFKETTPSGESIETTNLHSCSQHVKGRWAGWQKPFSRWVDLYKLCWGRQTTEKISSMIVITLCSPPPTCKHPCPLQTAVSAYRSLFKDHVAAFLFSPEFYQSPFWGGWGWGVGVQNLLINISIFAPSFDLGVVIGVCSASSATFFIIQTMFGVDLNPPAFLQWHSNNRIFKRLQLRCIGNHTIFMHFVSNSADVQTLDGEIFQHNQSSSTHTSHQHLNEVLSLGSLFALNGFTMIIVMALRCTVKVFANNANNDRDNHKDGSWTMAPFPKKSNYVSTDSQSSDTQSGCR